jgi:hypothetical protein
VLVLAIDVGVAGIVVGGLATVGVAGITAVTTNRRQHEALRHDRELFDLADLRKLLDKAAVALNNADDARIALDMGFAQYGRKVSPESLDAAKDAGNALYALRERLAVRLGRKHVIARHFTDAIAALLTTWHAVAGLDEEADATAVKESRQRIVDSRRLFDQAADGFIEAAVERAGTVPTRDGSTDAEPS